MKITCDPRADALYLYLKKAKVHETKKVSKNVFVDVDKKGRTIGVEFLNYSKQIDAKKRVPSISVEVPLAV